MLTIIADFIIALLDLVEAELKSVQRSIMLLCATLVLGLASVLGAMGLLLWAFYLVLLGVMEQPEALFLCALVLILIGGVPLCYLRRMLR
jgi:hypothetical protein